MDIYNLLKIKPVRRIALTVVGAAELLSLISCSSIPKGVPYTGKLPPKGYALVSEACGAIKEGKTIGQLFRTQQLPVGTTDLPVCQTSVDGVALLNAGGSPVCAVGKINSDGIQVGTIIPNETFLNGQEASGIPCLP